MKKKGKKPASDPWAHLRIPKVPKGPKWLVLVDDTPFRKKLSAKCQRLMAKIEEVRGEMETFQKDDLSAFHQWVATHFGPALSELRENEAAIRQKQGIIHLVETEVFVHGRTYREAYARVMARQTESEPEASEVEDELPPFTDDEGDAWDDESNPADAARDPGAPTFRDFVRNFTGRSVDELTTQQYDELYELFKTMENLADLVDMPLPNPAPKKSLGSRLKELYRTLVRRLHPDTKAEGETKVSALWHEVQQAYQDGNVERLEVLLAMTDMVEQTNPEQTTLGQMQMVAITLERDLGALRRSVKEAKKDHAWNFSRRTDRGSLAKQIRVEMEEELSYQRQTLGAIESQLKRWSVPPAGKKKAPELHREPIEKKPPKKQLYPDKQGEFGF